MNDAFFGSSKRFGFTSCDLCGDNPEGLSPASARGDHYQEKAIT